MESLKILILLILFLILGLFLLIIWLVTFSIQIPNIRNMLLHCLIMFLTLLFILIMRLHVVGKHYTVMKLSRKAASLMMRLFISHTSKACQSTFCKFAGISKV